jgi:hypothetical protein
MARLMTGSVAAKQQTETWPAVDQIAAFAAKTKSADLAPEIQQRNNRNVLNGLVCARVAL